MLNSCHGPHTTCTGWDSLSILRYLLLLAAIAPAILTYIIIRGHALSWPRGELTAVTALAALTFTIFRGVIDKPGSPPGEISVNYGWWVALLGGFLILIGSICALAGERSAAQTPRSALMTTQESVRPDRNLALELVRVTEAAALAAARMVGRGDKEAADQAAVDAMRYVLDSVSMDGIVVIGEGEKDEAPMLYNGEQIGDGSLPKVDIAVDPLEGTRLTALGMPSAIAVIALAERGSMFDPGPCVYMEKIAGRPRDRRSARPRPAAARDDQAGRRAQGDRHPRRDGRDARPRAPPRGDGGVREAGARVRLILDGDVSAALLAVSDNSPVDLLWGIGGTPEGVISAAAIKCIGGQLLGRLWPRNDEERQAAVDAGYDLARVLDLRRPRGRQRRVLLRHRRHRRRRAAGRPLPGRPRRHDRVAGDALALGHGAPGLRAPRPHEAARADRRPLRLSARRSGIAGVRVRRGSAVRLRGQACRRVTRRARASRASAGTRA